MASALSFSADKQTLLRINDQNQVTALSLTSTHGVNISSDNGDVVIQTASSTPSGFSIDMTLDDHHWAISFDPDNSRLSILGETDTVLGIRTERYSLSLDGKEYNLKKETGKIVLTSF
jgi:hypothetical protein